MYTRYDHDWSGLCGTQVYLVASLATSRGRCSLPPLFDVRYQGKALHVRMCGVLFLCMFAASAERPRLRDATIVI